MIERKGLDLLLRAFSKAVEEDGVNARLTLAGRSESEGPWLSALSERVRTLIDYRGFVQPPDLPKLFAEADVFVLPSRHDGWGVVVNQAIGSGLPVIATNAVGAAVELVENGKNGFVVPSHEVDALHQSIVALASSATLRQQFSSRSLEIAQAYSPSQGAQKMYRFLNSLS